MLICIAILQKVEFYSLGQVVEVKFWDLVKTVLLFESIAESKDIL